MKPLPPLFAILIVSWLTRSPALADENVVDPKPTANPDAPIRWTSKVKTSITARFVGMSGDMVVLDEEGRERRFSISDLSVESARLARQLGGIDEPLAPVPAAKPLIMEFKDVEVNSLGKSINPRDARKHPPPPYKMGSPDDELGRTKDWEDLHTVWFTRSFKLKTTEVTWAEWNAVRVHAEDYEFTDISPGQNGQGGGEDSSHPVVGITWWDAIKWCNLASRLHSKTPVYYTHKDCKLVYLLKDEIPSQIHANWNADGYRLPTEAEWEFACRPGSSKRAFHTGSIKKSGVDPLDGNLNDAGWYAGNSKGTRPVKGKSPNGIDLYDMHGNAAEWCWDLAGKLGTAEVTDPRGAEHGEARIIRGGSWLDPAENCRAAWRGTRNPTAMPNPSVGFRLAITIPQPEGR